MKKWKFLILLVSVVFIKATGLNAQAHNTNNLKLSVIASFNVKKVTDSNAVLFHIPAPDKPLLLFIFLSPECPLSKNYTLTLNKLFQQYNGQVRFYGCISGSTFTHEEIKSFITTYKVAFPFIVDDNKSLTRYTHATVTPEVVLLNKEGERIYSGAIDDWVQGLGKQKAAVSKPYLQDAIEAYLTNKNVAVKTTKAYGCLINDY